jgi:hypothetical protein
LKLDTPKSGRIDGDAGVPFAFQLDRLVLANDFATKFKRATLVRNFDKLGRLAGTRRRSRDHNSRRVFAVARRRGKLAVPLLHAGFDYSLK